MLRFSLFIGLAGAAFMASSDAAAQVPLETELFVQGINTPVDLTFAPGDSTRVFIVQRGGQIRVVENGVLLATPFLNIDPAVLSGGERGLLGLAFHPDYQNNGRFFVNFTNNSGDTRIAEYAGTADPNVASNTLVQFIAQIPQDFSNHNGGCVRFGPDGMLYVGMGDGGSGNDPNNRAQDGGSLLGKMLRYDVDLAAPFIPADNPFVGISLFRDEIWQYGMRNPWRFTFDRDTGDMWIGDVGQGQREEIDFIPAGAVAGQNFGWRCKEGTRCTGLTGCSCSDGTLIDPIQEYSHTGGNCSVTGGMIYRGGDIPSLDGTYFYADYCSSQIWSLQYDGTQVTNFQNRTAELDPAGTANISAITAFGEDHDGEVYILTQSGRIWKIIPEPPQCGYTTYCQATTSASGVPVSIFGSGTTLISANNFAVGANGMVPGTFGLFFYGPDQASISSGFGNLCINGNAMMPLIRLQTINQADIFGSVFQSIDFTNPQQMMGPGAINAGDSMNFQYWCRDIQNGTGGWNYSNALNALFCP